MKKIEVTICTGKYCCGTETAWFKQFESILSAKLRSQIKISGAACPGYCPFERNPCTPHISVDGFLVPNATPGAVINAVRHLIAQQNRPARKVA